MAGYLLAVPLAFVRPWIALAIYVGIAVIWFVPDRRIERGLIGLRRFMETAHLAHELQSGGGNLLRGHQRVVAA